MIRSEQIVFGEHVFDQLAKSTSQSSHELINANKRFNTLHQNGITVRICNSDNSHLSQTLIIFTSYTQHHIFIRIHDFEKVMLSRFEFLFEWDFVFLKEWRINFKAISNQRNLIRTWPMIIFANFVPKAFHGFYENYVFRLNKITYSLFKIKGLWNLHISEIFSFLIEFCTNFAIFLFTPLYQFTVRYWKYYRFRQLRF